MPTITVSTITIATRIWQICLAKAIANSCPHRKKNIHDIIVKKHTQKLVNTFATL